MLLSRWWCAARTAGTRARCSAANSRSSLPGAVTSWTADRQPVEVAGRHADRRRSPARFQGLVSESSAARTSRSASPTRTLRALDSAAPRRARWAGPARRAVRAARRAARKPPARPLGLGVLRRSNAPPGSRRARTSASIRSCVGVEVMCVHLERFPALQRREDVEQVSGPRRVGARPRARRPNPAQLPGQRPRCADRSRAMSFGGIQPMRAVGHGSRLRRADR